MVQNKWICCFLDLSNPIQVLEEKGLLAVDDLKFLAIKNERFEFPDCKWTQLFKHTYPGKQCLGSQRNTSLSACILQIIQRLSC